MGALRRSIIGPNNYIFKTELISSPFSFTSLQQIYISCNNGSELYESVYAGNTYRHVLKYSSWPKIVRAKKHISVDHCRDIPANILNFRKKWNGVAGIYKITFLPFRLFTYYGASTNLGMRFKYHYYNGAKQRNFLGFFFKTFG